ncbi:MAG: hypothetical protein AB1730_09145 [Myxococcota bacterium]
MRKQMLAFAFSALGLVCFSTCGLASGAGGGDVPNGGLGAGASAGGNGTGGSGGGSGTAGCTSNAECPTSYTCQAGTCVPPEQETNRSLSDAPPVATPHYVYALNPSAASVARIDPVSLSIEALAVGPRPVGLSAMPGEDAAVVLSVDDASLSLIDSTTLPSKVTRVPLKRQFGRLTVSPDGAFAVAWPDPSTAPASGAEGVFALVDLKKARANAPAVEVVVERAGGYRITDVVFRTEAGVATQLYVFAKSTVSTFDLPAGEALPTRLTLPASMSTAITAREVVASDDGHVVMLRGTTSPELASFDGTSLTVLPLPEVATDLDLLPDGTAAVAALRVAGELAYIELPGDLAPDAGLDTFPVPGGAVGQVALPPAPPDGGMFAFVYSNVTGDESFARVDLPSGRVQRYALEKLVDEIAVSPDATAAVILHRADPTTTASDPYDAAVDRDQGFSVFDIGTGAWQLQRTGTTRPTRFAFSPRGGYLGVALRDDGLKRFALQAVNLSSLVSQTLTLASAPLFMGTVPEAPGVTPHRVFVSQDHPAGRISVIQLDSGQVRTATGFTLNGEIR